MQFSHWAVHSSTPRESPGSGRSNDRSPAETFERQVVLTLET